VQQHRRQPKHKIRTPEQIEVAEVRRKQKERERNRKVRERLKAPQTTTSASRNVLESELIYPHGRLAAKTLKGIDGYLLALQYENPASLGKALGALRGEIYWLPPENDRALIWLPTDVIHKLPHEFSARLTYLAQFDVAETKRPVIVVRNRMFCTPAASMAIQCGWFVSSVPGWLLRRVIKH
jgi:hypothetical protein